MTSSPLFSVGTTILIPIIWVLVIAAIGLALVRVTLQSLLRRKRT